MTLLTVFPVTEVNADTAGTVTIDESVLAAEVPYYNYITVKFAVTNNPGWVYSGSHVYISGVDVDSTTNTSFEKQYYPEAYVGERILKVESHFINIFFQTQNIDDEATFTVVTCSNTTDLESMRIDKLQEYETGKTWLDGSGVTICLIDDRLGAHSDLSGFHKSLIRSGKNDIYGNSDRKYIDIKYFEDLDDDGNFSEEWEDGVDTKQEKWEEIFSENSGNYSQDSDVHGTYCLATLRQIAPAANYIFISVNDSERRSQNAVKWLQDDRDDPVFDYKAPYDYFDIDIISMSWSNSYYTDFATELEAMANDTVIPVAAVGQYGKSSTEGRIYYYSSGGKFPCYSDDVIGVTGVLDGDSSFGSSSRWDREIGANSGYGVDIASIFAGTQLSWEPVPNYGEFIGTSNACPMVAGTLALLEQYRNTHKTGTTFNITFVRTLFEETGDAPGSAPSSNTTEIGGYLDWINDNINATYYEYFPYHDNAPYATYDLGWGIIDGYEMYKYFRQNY